MFSFEDVFKNKKRVLFVTPHPDDIEVFFAGTLARLQGQKTKCFFQVLTSGSLGKTEDAQTKIREQEQRESLKLVGIKKDQIEFSRLRDGFVENDLTTIGKIVSAIRHWRPEMVCSFDPRTLIIKKKYVMHRDHRHCGQATIDAVYPYARVKEFLPKLGKAVTVKEILLADPFKVNCRVEFTDQAGLKKKMLLTHKSQWGRKPVEILVKDNKKGNKYFEEFNYYKLIW